MAREWYKYGERKSAELSGRITRAFRKSRLTLNFDELNVLKARKEATRLYKQLAEFNRAAFQDVAHRAYSEACGEAGQPDRKLDAEWLAAFLVMYNPVTKYVYGHEVSRKRARFFEALVSDLQAGDRRAAQEDYDASARAWLGMTFQTMIDVEDAAVLEGYRDSSVRRVTWHAVGDDRKCKTCRELDGQTFAIGQVPTKPHWGCRCWLTPEA